MADNAPGLIISPTTSRTSNTPSVMSGNRSALSHPAVRQGRRLIMPTMEMSSAAAKAIKRMIDKIFNVEAPSVDRNNLSNKTEVNTNRASPI